MDYTVLYFVLLLLAAICFAVDAFVVSQRRVHLLALGLFLWVLVPLIQHARGL